MCWMATGGGQWRWAPRGDGGGDLTRSCPPRSRGGGRLSRLWRGRPDDATGSRDRTGRVRAGLPIGWGGGAHARRRRRRGRGGGGVCGRIASHSYCTPRAFPWWVVGFEARLRFLSLPTMHSILFNGYYLRSFFR